MADVVQYNLERMIPELEDLQKRGIFTRDEIKAIVKRRTHYEYLLKKPQPAKRDFLAYIAHEKAVDELRALRRRKMHKDGYSGSGSMSDKSIAQRVVYIYERAVKKFPNDLQLWNDLIRYSKKMGRTSAITQLFVKALKMHPRIPDFWIAAGEHEYSVGNVKGARTMVQRGLRLNGDSTELWLAHVDLELKYMEKMRERRRVLGLDPLSAGDTGEDGVVGVDAVLRGDVVWVVCEHALNSLPHNVQFANSLVTRVLAHTHMDDVARKIIAVVTQDAGESAHAAACAIEAPYTLLRARAMRVKKAERLRARQRAADGTTSDSDDEEKGVNEAGVNEAEWVDVLDDVADTYINTLGDDDCPGGLWQCYTEFLRGVAGDIPAVAASVQSKLLEGYKNAHDTRECTVAMYLEWMGVAAGAAARTAGNNAAAAATAAALDVLAAGCSVFPSDTGLWMARVKLVLRECSITGDFTAYEQVMSESVSHVTGAKSAPLYELSLSVAIARGLGVDALTNIYQAGITATGLKHNTELATTFVEWVYTHKGLSAARRVYKDILGLPGPPDSLFEHFVGLEESALKPNTAAVAEIMERAVINNSESTEVWLRAIKAATRANDFVKRDALYQRALRCVADPGKFVHMLTVEGV